MKPIRLAISAAIASLGIAGGAFAQEAVTTYKSPELFADVAAGVEDVIVNRGYVVDHRGFIGDMLKRTAGDVGAAKPVYKEAEFFQFCSAVLSRAAMEADIGNIAYCPYVLFVYEAEQRPGEIVVGFRRLPDGDGRDDVNALLDEIAKEAAGQ